MMITAHGGDSPNAWKHAHSVAMSNPHHTRAPRTPGSRSRNMRTAVRRPLAAEAGTARGGGVRAPPATLRPALEAALDVVGQQADQRTHADRRRAEDRGHHREPPGGRAGEDAPAQPEAEDDQRHHVDAVEQAEEGDHPAGD